MLRKILVASSLVALVVGLIPPAGATQSGAVFVGQVTKNRALFWEGYIEDSLGNPLGADPDVCNLPTMDCRVYTFEVTEPAQRLRVALASPSATEIFGLDIFDPSGRRVATGGGLTWDIEKFVDQPALGTWTVRVRPTVVEESAFRVRAKLEDVSAAKSHKPATDLLPNLRLTPPFEFTFEAPLSLLGPGLGVGGQQPVTCTPRETAENQAIRCLRFSMGPQNVGDGLLELKYQPTASPNEPVPVTQVIHRSDGSVDPRPGGTAEYHAKHAHYHHDGFGAVELYRVLDAKNGEIEHAGSSPKQGYCIAPYVIVNWADFSNEPVKRSTCETRGQDADPSKGAEMFLSKGWSDVYSWALDDNYTNFGTSGDGLYLVRSTTDPRNVIAETDETDNTSYAFISVEGTSIEVLERGYGSGPWDNRKILAEESLLYNNADTKWVPFNDHI